MELNIIKNHCINSSSQTPTIIFLHGNSMNSLLFKNQIYSKRFENYNLIAIDLPGHGKSEHLEYYSIPKVVEIVYQNLKVFKNIFLVGHSLGGHIAIQLLPYLETNCIGVSLISCCPLTIPLNVVEAYDMNEVSSYFLQKHIPDNIYNELIEIIYENNDKAKIVIENSVKNTDSKFRSDIANSLSKQEIKDELEILRNYQGKLCFIVGDKDQFIKHSYLQKITEDNLLKSELHTIQNAGHSPYLNYPNHINEILINLLN